MAQIYPAVKDMEWDILSTPQRLLRGTVYKDGKLKIGFRAVNTRKAPPAKNINFMISDRVSGGILGMCTSGEVYYSNVYDFSYSLQLFKVNGFVGAAVSAAEPDRNMILLITNKKYARVRNGQYGYYDTTIYPECAVMCGGRLFYVEYTDQSVLKWTGPGGYEDFEEGLNGAGKLRLPGDCSGMHALFDLGGELALLTDGGVIHIDVSGAPQDFKVTKVCGGMGAFVYNTARLLGGYIYAYVTGSGVIRYKNGVASPVPDCPSDISSATSAYVYGGRYYCLSGQSKALGRQALYIYDAAEDAWQLVDAPITCMCRDFTSALGYASDTVYRVREGTSVNAEYSGIDFGAKGRKFIRSLELEAEGNVSVTISNGIHTRSFYLSKGKEYVGLSGNEFSVKINGSYAVNKAVLRAGVIV